MEPDPLMTPRLEAWLRRTQTPLDLLALLTIWLTILPLTTATGTGTITWWLVARLVLSTTYGIDIVVRARLSTHTWRYLRTHPLGVVVVVIPALRVVFSVRLLRAMFHRGNLGHFLFVALVLLLNGVIMVYTFEVDAPGANIVTLADSLWWACVTVATVGYGDFYPVTTGGRITAVALMVLGLTSAAVVTAQIASSFMDQAAARRATLAAAGPQPATGRRRGSAPPAPPVDDLHAKLDRIERLLAAAAATAEGDPDPADS
jgi:voltage-gated potassium channel